MKSMTNIDNDSEESDTSLPDNEKLSNIMKNHRGKFKSIHKDLNPIKTNSNTNTRISLSHSSPLTFFNRKNLQTLSIMTKFPQLSSQENNSLQILSMGSASNQMEKIHQNKTDYVEDTSNITKNYIHSQSKGVQGLFTVLFLKKNARKLSQYSAINNLKKLNKYHLNLIGDKTCEILDKRNINYERNFHGIMKSITDENSQKLILYDEMLKSRADKFSRKKTIKLKIKKNFEYKKICQNFMKYFSKFKFIASYFHVISPESVIKLVIDVITLLEILFCIFYLPLYNIFWMGHSSGKSLILISIIFHIWNLLISLNVGYIENGIIYIKRKLIFLKFLGFHTLNEATFLVILINLYNENETDFHYASSNTHFFRSTMVIFLLILKFFQLKQLIIYLVDYFLNLDKIATLIISLIQLCFFLLVCAHILTCQWILIAKYEDDIGNYTWLRKFNLENGDWQVIYLNGLYWAFVSMLTVGYGDIVPHTTFEKSFCILSMIITCCIFAYIMNTIGNLLEELNIEASYIRKQQNFVNHFLKEKKIDLKLQLKIKKHLVGIWSLKRNKKIEMESFLEMIPKNFQQEVLFQIYGNYSKQNKILTMNFPEKMIINMCLIAKEKIFIPESILMNENILDDCSYFYINKGKVQLYYGSSFIVKQSSKLEWFGEKSFFTGKEREISVKSIEYTSIIMFPRNQFIDILHENKCYERYCYIKDRILLYECYQDIHSFCLSCRSSYHLTKDCNFLGINRANIMLKIKPKSPDENERTPFLRKKEKKSNALKHQALLEKIAELYYEENYMYITNRNLIIRITQEQTSHSLRIPTDSSLTPEESAKSISQPKSGLISEDQNNSLLENDKNIDKRRNTIDKNNQSIANKRISSLGGRKSIHFTTTTYETNELKLLEIDEYQFFLNFEITSQHDFHYFPHNNLYFIASELNKKYNEKETIIKKTEIKGEINIFDCGSSINIETPLEKPPKLKILENINLKEPDSNSAQLSSKNESSILSEIKSGILEIKSAQRKKDKKNKHIQFVN